MRLFNSGKTDQFKPQGKVLEIGPGPAPIKADVYLDISAQYLEGLPGKSVVQGNATALPFADHSFDYCVAMHIAEHIPLPELPTFFKEITRVARAGYLEVPSVYVELLANADEEFSDFGRENVPYDAHQSYWWHDGTTVHIIKKSNSGTREKHIIRTLYHRLLNPSGIVGEYVDLFMLGFGWQQTVSYQIHDGIEVLPPALFEKILEHVHHYAQQRQRAKAPVQHFLHHAVDRLFTPLP